MARAGTKAGPTRQSAARGRQRQDRTLRAAVYCRQSVADSLEFNSIDLQRHACLAYIESQRGEGWQAIDQPYEDRGFSGGNVERPGYQRLVAAVERGEVDVVVVYRLDRLSRSVLDFMQTLALFETHGTAFVSVSEQFNTQTPMGRFTLGILMGVAQLERETIAERTRDKIHATRRKGLWTGGQVPLGYDLVEKRLVVNESEAARVREIFRLYLELASLIGVSQELNRRGWRTKSWTLRNGEVKAGRRFNKARVRGLLTNPIYSGHLPLKGEVFRGRHEPLVDETTWRRVQALLSENGKRSRARRGGRSGAVLSGLLRCRCGAFMTVHTSKKRGRRHRSYVCQRYQKEGAAACPGSRIPLERLERFVVEQVRAVGRDPEVVAETLAAARRELARRRPELEVELEERRREERELSREREALLGTVVRDGERGSVLERLGKLDAELERLRLRVAEIERELVALEGRVIDECDLRQALSAFDSIWGSLVTAEKARVLELLIEGVIYDGGTGEVELELRPGGLRELAKESEAREA